MYVLSTDHSLWPRLSTKLFLEYIKDVNRYLFWHRQLLPMAISPPFPPHDWFCPHYELGDCCLCDKLPTEDLVFRFIFCLVPWSTDSITHSLFNTQWLWMRDPPSPHHHTLCQAAALGPQSQTTLKRGQQVPSLALTSV